MIAEIIPEKRTSTDKETFSYLVPEELKNQISVGSIAEVPFGKKKIRGIVAKLLEDEKKKEQNITYELKSVLSIKQSFTIPPEYVRVAKWVSEYYLCSLGEAISLFLPPALIRARKIKQDDIGTSNADKQLSKAQEAVFQELKQKLGNSGNPKPSLLLGVTSSGKTEIYIKLAREVLAQGKQVVVLVPEIILTPQTVERFEAVFKGKIALIHSELSKSERLKNYEDFYNGVKPIIIGPRSALLVPSDKLGLIIIDEENEAAYKQEKNPKYNAVRLAEEISKETGALLLLGGATPTIETYHRATKGEIDLFELPARYSGDSMPKAEIVDLKEEIKGGNYSPISEKLQEAVYKTLQTNRHVFLFLNRRGAATFISCRECGEVILCPNCSIPLVYHLDEINPRGLNAASTQGVLNCHHCDYTTKVPYSCPVCGSYKIKYFGAGVEKIEAEIRQLFPSAKIRRIDSRILNSKSDYFNLYKDLKDGKIDILIGTQIIAKGLDIPTVDLVGIISADVGLHLPYYKADEKTFQILTQVSGRSGRGENEGKTLIQTYWPESRAVQAAKEHDYKLFYKQEIENREIFGDPPFSHLVRVVSEDIHREKAKEAIEKIAEEAKKREIEYTGPAKAFLSKIRGKHRYHIIFKVKELPNKALTEVFKTNPYLHWDVDPEDLL